LEQLRVVDLELKRASHRLLARGHQAGAGINGGNRAASIARRAGCNGKSTGTSENYSRHGQRPKYPLGLSLGSHPNRCLHYIRLSIPLFAIRYS
jgi:hypothetical protein